jgi:serine/threonine protein kinase
MNLKIADFGLSALKMAADEDGGGAIGENGQNDKLLFHTTCGTPHYIAPEVIRQRNGTGYDGRASDIWSMGVILFVFVSGRLPFNDDSQPTLFKKIKKAQYEMPNGLTEELQDLIYQILDPNPQSRITMDEIKRHSWFQVNDGPLPARRASKRKNLPKAPNSEDPKRVWKFKEVSATAALAESKAVSFLSSKYADRGDLVEAIETALVEVECTNVQTDPRKVKIVAERDADASDSSRVDVTVRVMAEMEESNAKSDIDGGRRQVVSVILKGPLSECHTFLDEFMQEAGDLADGECATEL